MLLTSSCEGLDCQTITGLTHTDVFSVIFTMSAQGRLVGHIGLRASIDSDMYTFKGDRT